MMTNIKQQMEKKDTKMCIEKYIENLFLLMYIVCSEPSVPPHSCIHLSPSSILIELNKVKWSKEVKNMLLVFLFLVLVEVSHQSGNMDH